MQELRCDRRVRPRDADTDRVVLSHARALLATSDGVTVVSADLRDPAAVLAHTDSRAVIDPAEPVCGHVLSGVARKP